MLLPAIYMLQVYDRVLGSNSTSTLIMLTLLAAVLFIMLGALEWIRSQILIRVSARFDVLLNERLYQVLFRQALVERRQNQCTAVDRFAGLTAVFNR